MPYSLRALTLHSFWKFLSGVHDVSALRKVVETFSHSEQTEKAS
jgi:hypothetical protein